MCAVLLMNQAVQNASRRPRTPCHPIWQLQACSGSTGLLRQACIALSVGWHSCKLLSCSHSATVTRCEM